MRRSCGWSWSWVGVAINFSMVAGATTMFCPRRRRRLSFPLLRFAIFIDIDRPVSESRTPRNHTLQKSHSTDAEHDRLRLSTTRRLSHRLARSPRHTRSIQHPEIFPTFPAKTPNSRNKPQIIRPHTNTNIVGIVPKETVTVPETDRSYRRIRG